MTRQPTGTSLQRLCRIELFESRTLMTADPLLALDAAPTGQAELQLMASSPSIGWYSTMASNVRNWYGFEGQGQTVAIIDSGIAWDHYALGGGYGPNARVVGGWDFAENDANPYDDGPAGFHGTHVAGIVGAQHSTNSGVAPGVDLVALRVFNDQGQGQMDWVRQALQWVGNHRDSFQNPITAVNLSLGAEWNGNAPPNWANLESELLNLRNQGIFISVAAGNSFQQYLAQGLSYPAASSYVVPVASHGAYGELSDFSQRNERVLAAPGESIKSTVPDHLFGGTQTNQFLSASGTSMAAPYVAGASTLLRQAYDFVGYSQVGQPTLLQRFSQTADRVYDPQTAAWYDRLNLEAAIASVIVDQQGDAAANSFQVGSLGQNQVLSGHVGTKQDVDWYQFTASASGQLTLDVATTHGMPAAMTVLGTTAQWNGQKLVMNVTSGQQYKVSISSLDGIGHYEIRAQYSESTANAVDWGKVFSATRNVAVDGQQNFRVTAGRGGLMTVSADVASGSLSFKLLNANMQTIATATQQDGQLRFDAQVAKDGVYYIQVQGSGSAHVNLVNLVNLYGGRLTVHGTNKADHFEFTAGQNHTLRVNGMDYQFASHQITSAVVNGHQGADLLELELSQADEQITLRPNFVAATSSELDFRGLELRTIRVDGGGGMDRLEMVGSVGNDRLFGAWLNLAMSGEGYSNYAHQISTATVKMRTGYDTVDLSESRPLDYFQSQAGWVVFQRAAQSVSVYSKEYVIMPASGPGALATSWHTAPAVANPLSSVHASSGFKGMELSHSWEGHGAAREIDVVPASTETIDPRTAALGIQSEEAPAILQHGSRTTVTEPLVEAIVDVLTADDLSVSLTASGADLVAVDLLFSRVGRSAR